MRMVEWTDKKGYRHRALVRDGDPDRLAESGAGISQDPPDIEELDWEEIKRNLHNALVEYGIVNWLDVQRQGAGVTGAVLVSVRRPLIELYKITRR